MSRADIRILAGATTILCFSVFLLIILVEVMPNNNNLFVKNALPPLLFWMYLGVLPLMPTQNGHLRKPTPSIIISVIVGTTISLATPFLFYIVVTELKGNYSYANLISRLPVLTPFIGLITFPIFAYLRAKYVEYYAKLCAKFEADYLEMAETPLELNYSVLSWSLVIMSILVTLLLTVLITIVNPEVTVLQMFLLTSTVFVTFNSSIYFITGGLFLIKSGEELLKFYKKNLESVENKIPKLRKAIKLWYELTELVDVGFNTSFTDFFIISLALFNGIVSIYVAFSLQSSSLAANKWRTVYSGYSIVCFLNVFTYCEVSQAIKKQVWLFLEVIVASNMEVTMGAFANANRQLFIQIVSAVSTYLIILKQFGMLSGEVVE